jgi:hypothetical protein
MSLINEALKKAQRQRTLDNAPLSGAPTGVAAAAVTTHVAVATRRRSSLAPVWFGLGLLVLGVVSTVLIMRYGFGGEDAPAVASVTPAPATPAPVAPIPATSAPVATAPLPAGTNASSEPTITFTLPVPVPATPVVAPAPAPAPVAITPVPVVFATPTPDPTPVAPVALSALSDSEREARIYAFLSEIRLTGVRGLDREARVLMNEKVFRLNDTVDADLGLRLSGVRPGILLFTDSRGRTYEKRH